MLVPYFTHGLIPHNAVLHLKDSRSKVELQQQALYWLPDLHIALHWLPQLDFSFQFIFHALYLYLPWRSYMQFHKLYLYQNKCRINYLSVLHINPQPLGFIIHMHASYEENNIQRWKDLCNIRRAKIEKR